MGSESFGLSRYKTFIFDWDGTLNSPSLLNHPIWLRLKRKSDVVSKGEANENDIKRGIEFALTAKTKADFEGMEEATFVKLADIFFSLLKPRFHSGAREFLDKLNASGCDVALFTDGGLKRVFIELKHLNAIDYFDVILSAQSIKRIKPDPAGLKVILRMLNAKKGTSIYFGDRSEDILAAKRAGISSAAMLNGFSRKSILESADPDFMFESMEKALKAFAPPKEE